MTSPAALAYSAFRLLPLRMRRLVIRTITPSYVVGAVIVVQRAGDEVLLLRERHHDGWGLPGGLIRRKEQAVDAAVRELWEETGVRLAASDMQPPTVNIDPMARRVDVVFRVAGDALTARACEPEVLEARWFRIDELPELFPPTVDALRAAGFADLDAPS